MESRGPEDSKNVKTSQAYFFEEFISFFKDFSLTIGAYGKFDYTCMCSDSGMVIIKILRLFSYSGLSIKLRYPEIGLYLAQEYTKDNLFIIFFSINIF